MKVLDSRAEDLQNIRLMPLSREILPQHSMIDTSWTTQRDEYPMLSRGIYHDDDMAGAQDRLTKSLQKGNSAIYESTDVDPSCEAHLLSHDDEVVQAHSLADWSC